MDQERRVKRVPQLHHFHENPKELVLHRCKLLLEAQWKSQRAYNTIFSVFDVTEYNRPYLKCPLPSA